MNFLTLALVGLRGAALALSLGGQQRGADSLYALADMAEAGQNVDATMQAVAEKLKQRPSNDADWEDVYQRIDADRQRLHAPKPPTG